MTDYIYSIPEIKRILSPIFDQYEVNRGYFVWVV